MLLKFIIGAAPVLGFLGTVVHFGTALTGLSFDEISDRLPDIVSHMGTAFNTTSVALTASMSMMFALFFCQRVDNHIARSIDHLVDRELAKRFEFRDPSIAPALSAVQSAHDEALRVIDATLNRQIELWAQALEVLFERFETRQQREVGNWQQMQESLEDRQRTRDEAADARLRQAINLLDSRRDQHIAELDQTLRKVASLGDGFGDLASTLQEIARGGGQLADLQTVLSDNLRLLHDTRQIDEALHGLTAAIHILTARHRPGSMAA